MYDDVTQVPVFLMDMLIGGKKYEWSMYFQVAVVTAGGVYNIYVCLCHVYVCGHRLSLS